MAEQTTHTSQIEGYSKGLEFTLSLCLCYTLSILVLRAYIRWRRFAVDDLIVCLSAALSFVFFGCSYASKAAGLARPMSVVIEQQEDFGRLNMLILAVNLSWITALCLSKLAVVSMLLSITLTAAHHKLQYLVGASVTIQCITSIVLITARCTGSERFFWSTRLSDAACHHQELRWRVITGLDIATELLILVLPVQLVWNLHMSTRNKMVVIAAFWLRIPTIAFTILRSRTTERLHFTPDVSLTAAMIVVWQAIELAYSIAAATIAALKRFTESLNTGFGHGELVRIHGQSQQYKLSDRSTSNQESGASKTSANSPANPRRQQETQAVNAEESDHSLQLRSDEIHNETLVSSPSQPSGRQLNENAHMEENVIRQYLRYSVHYDEQALMPGPDRR